MEGDFPTRFVAEGSGFQFPAPPAIVGHSSEERSINTSFSAFSGLNMETMTIPSAEYGFGTSLFGFPELSISDQVAMSYFNQDLMDFQRTQQIGGDQYMKPVNFDSEMIKLPKIEPVEDEWAPAITNEQINLGSEISNICNSSFYQLPHLRSIEHVFHQKEQAPNSNTDDILLPTLKRLRSSSSTDSYTLDAIVRKLPPYNPRSLASFKASNRQSPSVIPQSVLARQRRKMISDRTRCLQKLMPWDKKMDMATMLEEAYKYIKFLEAQVNVLQSMPCESSLNQSQMPDNIVGGEFGGLEKLNRQQMLQVLVNSPVAQTILYTQECCVYSLEQVVWLKQKKNLLPQMLSGPSRAG